jgi:Zn-dependent M28 family amino/carboxypeptidase
MTDAFMGTLGEPVGVPVVSTSHSIGSALAAQSDPVVRVKVDRVVETRSTRNLIAETQGGDPERVVIVGAHLDSGPGGPGINDNGSGAAAILEIAETYAAQSREPRNKLRFIWFSASEGNAGAAHYVNGLTPAERGRVLCMLNFDGLGSPNFARFVLDGDGSGGANTTAAPPGSAFVERVLLDYFASQGLAAESAPLDGGSDYAPFAGAGSIPVGGLTAGGRGIKTEAQAVAYGGVAGVSYDPCAGRPCDTLANSSDAALDQMSDAAAHAVLFFSKAKGDVRAQ